MTVLIAAAGSAGERVEATLSGHETERAETLAAVRERAPAAAAVVAGSVSDGDADEVAAAVERAAAGTPVFDADESELATAVERAVETGRYRDAVDELYELARERAESDPGGTEDTELERARAAADEAFERVRRVENRTPYDRLLDDERVTEDGESQTNP